MGTASCLHMGIRLHRGTGYQAVVIFDGQFLVESLSVPDIFSQFIGGGGGLTLYFKRD